MILIRQRKFWFLLFSKDRLDLKVLSDYFLPLYFKGIGRIDGVTFSNYYY